MCIIKFVEKEKLEEFRIILLNELQKIFERAGITINGMSSEPNFPDPGDRAELETHRGLTLRLRDRERKLMLKIYDALEKIENGTYGICEACGGEIGEERLRARPVTTLCIDCKEDQEEEERMRGE